AKAKAFPLHDISNRDGLPREIEMRKAALYALDLGVIAGSSSTEMVTKTEQDLADKLVKFVKENRPYLSDAWEIGTVVPGPGTTRIRRARLQLPTHRELGRTHRGAGCGNDGTLNDQQATGTEEASRATQTRRLPAVPKSARRILHRHGPDRSLEHASGAGTGI